MDEPQVGAGLDHLVPPLARNGWVEKTQLFVGVISIVRESWESKQRVGEIVLTDCVEQRVKQICERLRLLRTATRAKKAAGSKWVLAVASDPHTARRCDFQVAYRHDDVFDHYLLSDQQAAEIGAERGVLHNPRFAVTQDAALEARACVLVDGGAGGESCVEAEVGQDLHEQGGSRSARTGDDHPRL